MEKTNLIQFFIDHYDEILLAIMALMPLLEIIVRITPSQKDNSILNKVKALLDKYVPNKYKSKNKPE